MYVYIHDYVCTFLVNSLHALVLFDSGVIRTFVLRSFIRYFYVPLGLLDLRLEVAIVDDRTISTLDVYHDCVLEIFCVGFLIDLIHIPLRDVCVIMGMDWLTWF